MSRGKSQREHFALDLACHRAMGQASQDKLSDKLQFVVYCTTGCQPVGDGGAQAGSLCYSIDKLKFVGHEPKVARPRVANELQSAIIARRLAKELRG